MSSFVPMLADLDPADVARMQKPWSFTDLPYTIIILGVVIGVALLGSLVIIVFRGKGKRRHHRHHRHSSPGSPAAQPSAAGKTATAEGGERRRRRRRRSHRPINPTLAQTGGLPPVRDPNTPPPGL